MSELIARLYDNWRAWGSPINRETCINETCMAMDCKEAGEELERYKQALTRANGFLIMHDLEPVKLEYASATPEAEGRSPCCTTPP